MSDDNQMCNGKVKLENWERKNCKKRQLSSSVQKNPPYIVSMETTYMYGLTAIPHLSMIGPQNLGLYSCSPQRTIATQI